MDHTTQMLIFVRCVEHGSFSAAARQLHMTPSAVSKQIRRLEDRLDARLFNRTTRRVGLTEVGQEFYRRCAEIMTRIQEAEEAVGSLQGEVRGTLRVTATAAFARVQVLPRLNRFLAANPDLNIEFELTDRPVDVLNEGIDVAIMLQEQVDDPSLVVRQLAVNRRVIVASPDYIRRNGQPETPDDLRHHNCVTLYNVTGFNDWDFEDGHGGTRRIHVDGNFHANTASGVYEAARAGVGVARLSTWLVAPDLEAGRLVPVLPGYVQENSAYYVLFPQGRHLARKIRAFVDFLVGEFKPVAPWERADGDAASVPAGGAG
ncbi:LysR family transcriptional regulator [Aquisalimonas lutea]|uniref:LysR family transcriptional regulator n=1 Tax=Aquisalimonas lutea TaxID=1327750 RepID=UPI0025B29168|nr:LysR family transcriptional regulator [Aquisalimonas lutea]MDN3519846.1 LysR family transcriptional regulator [Aquisalimonas lutea]